MADKYQRIEKPAEVLPPNEIRVKRGVGIGRYLKRAHDLLTGTTPQDGQKPTTPITPSDSIVIKGVSNAVESAVKLAELIKHRIKGLHQCNKISHITIVDEYEPLEEGLDHLKFTRIVTMLEITLSKKQLDTSDVGYQPPIDESEVQEYSERHEDIAGEDGRKRRGRRNYRRGGGRGGRPRRDGPDGGRGQPRGPSQGRPGGEGRPQGEEGQEGGNRRRRRRGPRRGDGEETKQDGGPVGGSGGGRGPRPPRQDGGAQGEYTGGQGQRQPRRGGGPPGQGGNRGGYRDGGRNGGGRRGGGQGQDGGPRRGGDRGPRYNDRGPAQGGMPAYQGN